MKKHKMTKSAKDAPQTVEGLRAEADRLRDRGKYPEARELFKKAMKLENKERKCRDDMN